MADRGPAARLQGPAPDEQVLLDENRLAEGLEYFEVANLAISPDHRWLAYAIDTTGGEIFDLTFRSCRPGGRADAAPEVVPDTYYGLAWANDNATVFYTRVDDAMRPFQLWRHRLGTNPSADVMVLEEPDERFTLSVGGPRTASTWCWRSRATRPARSGCSQPPIPRSRPRLVEPRRPGMEYELEHLRRPDGGPGWFVILTNDEAVDFRLMVAPADATGPLPMAGGGAPPLRDPVGRRGRLRALARVGRTARRGATAAGSPARRRRHRRWERRGPALRRRPDRTQLADLLSRAPLGHLGGAEPRARLDHPALRADLPSHRRGRCSTST